MKKLILVTLSTVIIASIFTFITAKENNEYCIITKNNTAINNQFEGTISKDLEIVFTDFEFNKVDLIIVSGNRWKNYILEKDALKFHYQLSVKKDDFECNGTKCTYTIEGVKEKYMADYIVLVADGKEDNTYVEFKRK